MEKKALLKKITPIGAVLLVIAITGTAVALVLLSNTISFTNNVEAQPITVSKVAIDTSGLGNVSTPAYPDLTNTISMGTNYSMGLDVVSTAAMSSATVNVTITNNNGVINTDDLSLTYFNSLTDSWHNIVLSYSGNNCVTGSIVLTGITQNDNFVVPVLFYFNDAGSYSTSISVYNSS